MSTQTQLHMSDAPPVRCVLYVTNALIRIDCTQPLPNVWIRFWHRALLGWRWEKLP